jgi:hypothetical protein
LTGIVHLPLGINRAYAAELNSTQYVLKNQSAPFTGYLVEPTRLEKMMIVIKDLESTKNEKLYQEKYFTEKLEKEKLLAEKELAARKADAANTEKELKAKIVELNVWYKKPWFVAAGITAIFITTGILLP